MATSFHTRAVIVSTGDEIMLGQLLDTNARWLARQLVDRGVMPIEHVTVGDDLSALVEMLRRVCAAAPLVVMSGGLGPTDGDLTRQAVCELTGDQLVLDAEQRQILVDLLARRGRPMSERQERQAWRPSRARCLTNGVGTAPGLWVKVGETDLVCLPGPPGELVPMFEQSVVPGLRLDPSRVIVTRLLQVVGVAEAECVNRLGDLTKRTRSPLVGITASAGILTIRIRYEGNKDRGAVIPEIDAIERQIRDELGVHVFATGDGIGSRLLAARLINLLKDRGETLSVVESCTGGMLGELLTTMPGASAAFVGGVITYANEMKVGLGVDAKVIENVGVVSGECAEQMARAGLAFAKSDYAIAITGIAGPEGGSVAKPVGTVYIAVASRENGKKTDIRRFGFPGDREDVRLRSCVSAMAMLYFRMCGMKAEEPGLLWEVR